MEWLKRKEVLAGGVVGLIAGLLLGWFVIGWGLWPVKWTDAHSYDLAPEARAQYVALVADSFKLDKDKARAEKFLEGWSDEEKQQAFAAARQQYEAEARADKVQAIEDLALALGLGTPAAAPPAPTPPPPKPGLLKQLRVPCLILVAILLVVVLGWIGLRVALRRQKAARPPAPAVRPARPVPVAEEWEGLGQPPLGHFITTYQLGEDTYDESFSIETPMGEFLGECGVGISETIGPGDPDKVTAFEVWLFDKSDIRTVTKVLMSRHAFNNDALRARLASKGEAVLARVGVPFVLDTSGLQVQARVTEMDYGSSGELPPESFFSRLTVELVALTRPTEPGTGSF